MIAYGFPATEIAQHAGVTLIVRNTGAAATGAQAVTIRGAAAEDFSIVSGSTCDGDALAPGDLCFVRLEFAPTAPGARTAALRLEDGTTALEVPLAGRAHDASEALVADVTALDFGPTELAEGGDASVELHNAGRATVTLGAPAATGSFSIGATDCGAQLTPGNTCNVTVHFAPPAAGLATGRLTLGAATTSPAAQLIGLGLRRVTVQTTGAGSGTIASSPAGIACGATCSGLFLGDVTLTAVPGPDSVFAGWSTACGTSPTCALTGTGNETLTASFGLSDVRTIAVAFAGGAKGFAFIVDNTTSDFVSCTASCQTTVPPGDDVSVFGFTPSTFVSWMGGCTSTTNECDLGPVAHDAALTLTIVPDPFEIATLLNTGFVSGIALAVDGNVVIATSAGVSELSLAGATVWSTPMTGASDLASDDAGNIYGRNSTGVFALSPAGAVLWQRAFSDLQQQLELSAQSMVATSADGTVIAALTPNGAHVLDGGGADRATITSVRFGLAIAVAPDGTVAIATDLEDDNFPDQASALRFTSAGVQLATFEPLPGDQNPNLAYDPQGQLCTHDTSSFSAVIARLSPTGTPVFEHSGPNGGFVAAGVATDADSDVIAAHGFNDQFPDGLQLDVLSPTGASLVSHAKPPSEWFFAGFEEFDDGVSLGWMAGHRGKRFALAGSYNFGPWIQVYELP